MASTLNVNPVIATLGTAGTPTAGTPTAGTSFGLGESPANLATDTANANLMSMPYNADVATWVNSVDQAAQQAANAGRLGAAGQTIQNSLLTNTAANAAGQLAPDVVNNLEDTMAQRGGTQGLGVDSGNTNAALMRAMGLDSNALTQQAGTQYSQLLAENPSAPIYSAGTNLVSPATYSSTANNQAQLQFQYNQLNDQMYLAALKNRQGQGQNNIQQPAGSGGQTPTQTPTQTPAQPATGYNDPTATADPFGMNTYTPGGSSVFGGVDLGNGNYGDAFDPSGLAPSYGSMPDYSQVGADPMAGLTVDPSFQSSYSGDYSED